MAVQTVPPLSRNLRIKVIALVSVMILLSSYAERFLPIPMILTPFLPLIFVLLTVVGVMVLFMPIKHLYLSSRNLLVGQPVLPFHSLDEFQSVNDILIQISDQQQHLKQLSQNNALSLTNEQTKMQAILSAIQDGILIINLNRQVVLANQQAEQLTGLPLAQMQSKPLDQWFTIKDNNGRQIPATEFCPMTETQYKSQDNQPLTLVTTAAQKAIALVSAHINSTVQTDLGWVVVIRDAQKQQELDSKQVDFVSMASHELRTPLTSVKGYLSVFMDENKGKLTADQQSLLDRMMIATQQLESLVNNLLNVSKVERGAFTVNLAPLDWQKNLEMSVDENKLFAAQKNISVELLPSPTPLPQVMADNVRINEVINNLINNAINYTKQGGWVKVSSHVEGKEVITSVSDNGMGIPEDKIPHLFTKFFRAAGALDKSSNSKGSGLGLYMSKSIIDMHHGRIWVESKEGMGSTFSFSLPIAQTIAQADSSAVQNILNSVK